MTEFFNKNGDSYSGTVVWLTPKYIIDALEGPFDLDPCAPDVIPFKIASNTFNKQQNGLLQDWSKYKDVFINPPYDYISLKEYTKKAIEHKECIMLIYARTDTELFQKEIFTNAYSILFIKGRIKFLDETGDLAKNFAGAPSCLIAFNENMHKKLKNAIDNNLIKGTLIKLNF